MGRIVEQKPEPIVEPVDPELMKKVRAALEKRGYELPSFKNEAERRRFVELKRYDPKVVLNSTYQMAKVFRNDWRKRISPAPKEDVEDEE